MDAQALYILPLAVAAIAIAVAFAQKQKMGAMQPKSHKRMTAGLVLLLAAFSTGLATGSSEAVLVLAALGVLSLLAGFVQWGKELKIIGQVLREQRVDFVTGLYNRRTFDERLLAEHSRTKRTGMGYAIAVFELDEYDQMSDEDKLNGMKMLANALRESVRHTDTLSSISTTHIAVLMVDTRAEGGLIGVERARERFFFRSCGHDESAPVTRPMTASVGIAAWDDSVVDGQHVIVNAEETIRMMRKAGEHGVRIHRPRGYAAGEAAQERSKQRAATAA
ncbi:MAG: diguanylate cyclase [Actinobacteria bacterium]|nr:diguanylate cyclase [Actinomycetota bacterium]